ncbi:MAG: hypothetical protein PHI97_14590 [Desulfobulbus sp.]|nr:hypothetical protein [Desulfobulbus sp.]
MNVGGMNNSMASQVYQLSSTKTGRQVMPQPQKVQQQGPSEEKMESAAMKSSEAKTGGETSEMKSLNIYA